MSGNSELLMTAFGDDPMNDTFIVSRLINGDFSPIESFLNKMSSN